MSTDISESIIRITSSDASSTAFGTGFVVHYDDTGTYIVTCAHVVRDVGGVEHVRVGNMDASVVAAGEANGLDLAVLRVEGLTNRPALLFDRPSREQAAVVIHGYYRYDRYPMFEPINATLGRQFQLEDAQQRKAPGE